MVLCSRITDLIVEAARSNVNISASSEREFRLAISPEIASAVAHLPNDDIRLVSTTSRLGGNNRRSPLTIVSVKGVDGPRILFEKGYVFKQPQHRLEPRIARRASELSLGPKVFLAGDFLIVEELLPSESAWRQVRTGQSFLDGARLGESMVEQYVRMLTHRTVHAFDALPDHFFVLDGPPGLELRWIDWGRPRTLPEPLGAPGWHTVSHFTALVGLLLDVPCGPVAFASMLSAAANCLPDGLGGFLSALLSEVRLQLCNSRDTGLTHCVLLPRWEGFFKEVDGAVPRTTPSTG